MWNDNRCCALQDQLLQDIVSTFSCWSNIFLCANEHVWFMSGFQFWNPPDMGKWQLFMLFEAERSSFSFWNQAICAATVGKGKSETTQGVPVLNLKHLQTWFSQFWSAEVLLVKPCWERFLEVISVPFFSTLTLLWHVPHVTGMHAETQTGQQNF